MHFVEHHEGDLRIYAGAIEAAPEGYHAAVVVHRVRPGDGAAPQEVFREDRVCGGYAWPSPEAAMAFAVQRARSVMRREAHPHTHGLSDAAKAAAADGRSVGRRQRPARLAA
ncbi:MAG TPA: hypothetical protein VFB53_07195 [Burkholderiales bacterium]|nr:hypothetical protein [Burkholderiales bacterium]